MIEITESLAVGLDAAAKALTAFGIENPISYVRALESGNESGGLTLVHVVFWIGANPKFLREVKVLSKRTRNGWAPISAILEGPRLVGSVPEKHVVHFDEQGNIIKT